MARYDSLAPPADTRKYLMAIAATRKVAETLSCSSFQELHFLCADQ